MDYSYLYKIILIGDNGSGKSSFILRCCDDTYTDDFIATIGVDFKNKFLNFDDFLFKIQIWDPMIPRIYRNNMRIPYRGNHGIIIFFDLTNRETFENSKKWLQEVQRYACERVVLTLVGCKLDIVELDDSVRIVSYKEAHDFAQSEGMEYIECSSKYNINIHECIENLTQRIYNRISLDKHQPSPKIQQIQHKSQKCTIN